MAWRPVNIQDIQGRMTNSEQVMLQAAGGKAQSLLLTRLNDSLAAFNSAMAAVGNNIIAGQTPDRFRNSVTAYAVGEWLRDAPLGQQSTKVFWTDARKDAYKEACETLKQISLRLAGAIEDPGGYSSDARNWGGMNMILGRMVPIPPAQVQWSGNGPVTGNPNATSLEVQDLVPETPKNLTAVATLSSGIIIQWGTPNAAAYYILYRATTSGQELAGGPFATTTGYVFTDVLVSVGTIYFYQVVAVNQQGQSPLSNEATATAGVPIPTATSN